ncbi:MAG: MFS transporter [Bacillota bacterium]|nr:MAG: MFS transporter [Bacillota bacterium]
MKKSWVLLLMVLMAVFLNADNLVLSPNIDAIEAEFGISDADIGNISGLFVIVGALVSLIWGYLGDKGSRKLLFVLSVVIGEIPCALTALAANYSQFFWLRILTGIGMGASFPVAFSLVADLFEEKERAKATAFVAAAIGFGSVLGTVVGGYGGAAWGWRLPFFLVAAPNFLLGPLFWFTVKEPQRGMSEEGFKELVEQGYVYPRTIKFSDYRRLFTIRTNLLLFIQGIAGCVPWGAIPLFLVAYLNRVRGFDLNAATTVFLVFGLGNILGIIAGGLAGGALYRKSPSLVPVFSGITTVVGAVMAVLVFEAKFVSGFGPIVILGFFTSLMASLTGPNVKTMLMNVNVPENRGAIFSVFNLTDSLGTGIGRFVGGWLAQLLTIGPALTISSLFWIPCGILLLALVRLFPWDVEHLRTDMKTLAKELAGGGRE